MTTQILPIPALKDNYIWLIVQGKHAIVVDPGQCEPVLLFLAARGMSLEAILLTHHHLDHVGGVNDLLKKKQVPVWGAFHEIRQWVTQEIKEGDTFEIPGIQAQFSVLEVPGHTLGHVAFLMKQKQQAPALFCGDSLFSVGCGRIFEGDSTQMFQSLEKMRNLSENTKVYCAHEYTLSNILWALEVEPSNLVLQHWAKEAKQMRAKGIPTLPTTIGFERQVNPFFRVSEPSIKHAVETYAGRELATPVDVFAQLREWKNNF